MIKTLQDEIRDCTKCGLCKTMPFKPVPGYGPKNARIMIVGEAPGEEESLIEQPFVGLCGKLLTKMLIEAGINRDECYIANVVNCRPVDGTRNRPPTGKEIKACKDWVFQQIEEVNPDIIFTLGKVPTSTLYPKFKSTSRLKDVIGVPAKMGGAVVKENTVIPNFHPSYIMVYGKKELELAIEVFKKGKSLLT